MLLSFGLALLNGLEWAIKDRDPLLAFVGFWLGQIIFLVVPGLVIGGGVALATKRDMLGLRIMIGVNALVIAMYVYGMLREAGALP